MPPPQITKTQPSKNSILLEWSLSDAPSYLQVQVNLQAPVNLPASQTSYTVTGLLPGTTYSCAVCSGYDDEGLECSQPVSVTTLGGSTTPPIKIKITGTQAYPNHLVASSEGPPGIQSSGVDVSWASSVRVSMVNPEADDTSGHLVTAINAGGSDFPASSGTVRGLAVDAGAYLIKIRGAVSFNDISETWNWTEFSSSVQVTVPNNTHSLREFLLASGVAGDQGVRRFFPAQSTVSLKNIMGV